MKILVASLVGAFALLTTVALLKFSPERGDLAMPVMVSGLSIIGTLGLVGLGIWASRDIQARRQRGEDAPQS